jgi:hypothetical protein
MFVSIKCRVIIVVLLLFIAYLNEPSAADMLVYLPEEGQRGSVKLKPALEKGRLLVMSFKEESNRILLARL